MGAGFDKRTSSQLGNARFKLAKAIAEVASVVFWDKIVPTNESNTGFMVGMEVPIMPTLVDTPCSVVYGVSVEGNADVAVAVAVAPGSANLGSAVPRFPGPN
jgi:hypothetical protein